MMNCLQTDWHKQQQDVHNLMKLAGISEDNVSLTNHTLTWKTSMRNNITVKAMYKCKYGNIFNEYNGRYTSIIVKL